MTRTYRLEEEEDFGFLLYGIQTLPLDEYKWIFHLNQKLNIQLSRIQDFTLQKNAISYSFSQYHYHNTSQLLDIDVFSQLSLPTEAPSDENSLFEKEIRQEYLLPKYKNFQYILKLNSLHNTDFLLHLQAQSEVTQIQELQFKNSTELEKFLA